MKLSILLLALFLSTHAHAGPPVIWGPGKAQLLPAQLCFADTTCMSTAAVGSSFSLGDFGSTPAAKGASFSSDTLSLQPADATRPGSVSIVTQQFGGGKTFVGNADEVQVKVRANATQTSNLMEWHASNEAVRAAIDGLGNLALGTGTVTVPDGSANLLQVGNYAFIQNVVGSQAFFGFNAYYDGAWKRKNDGPAMGVRMNSDPGDGSLMFGTAVSGSAGSTFSDLTPRLTMRNGGNVGINTNDPSAQLDVNGTARVRDLLRLPVQGSGNTPTCDTDGNLAITNGHILCVCDGAAWKKVSDGSTTCTF